MRSLVFLIYTVPLIMGYLGFCLAMYKSKYAPSSSVVRKRDANSTRNSASNPEIQTPDGTKMTPRQERVTRARAEAGRFVAPPCNSNGCTIKHDEVGFADNTPPTANDCYAPY